MASVSVMPRRVSDDVGGRYTFTMFILWLFGSMSLASYPYSFPTDASSWKDRLKNVAIPPLVPVGLRCSTTLYPGSSGIWAPSAIQVS